MDERSGLLGIKKGWVNGWCVECIHYFHPQVFLNCKEDMVEQRMNQNSSQRNAARNEGSVRAVLLGDATEWRKGTGDVRVVLACCQRCSETAQAWSCALQFTFHCEMWCCCLWESQWCLLGPSPRNFLTAVLWCSVVPTNLGIAKCLSMEDKTSISTAVLTSPGLLAASPSSVISSPVSFGLGQVRVGVHFCLLWSTALCIVLIQSTKEDNYIVNPLEMTAIAPPGLLS